MLAFSNPISSRNLFAAAKASNIVSPRLLFTSPFRRNDSLLKLEYTIDPQSMAPKEENSNELSPVAVLDEKDIEEWVKNQPLPNISLVKTSLALELNVDMLAAPPVQNRPLIVGHRGSIYEYPENTVSSFLASNKNGCDAVELDVFLLKCGTLVVFHGGGTDENPGSLDEYCNIEGSILDYTAKEAREQLKLNPDYAEFPCPRDRIVDHSKAYVPTLEEVLIALKSTNMTVKIELKGPGVTEPVLELVEKLDMVDQCHYSSFAHERIARVRQLHPERNADGSYKYKTGALFADEVPEDFIDMAQSIGSSEVHLKYDTCTKERVDQIHAAGMGSMCWFRGPIGMTEDANEKYYDIGDEDLVSYEIVRRTGVGGMCVNKPDMLSMLLKTQETPQIPESKLYANSNDTHADLPQLVVA